MSESEILARTLRWVVLWSFERLQVAVIAIPPDQFVVDGRAFVVSFWCTPTVLWLGCLYLLGMAGGSLRSYLIWSLGLMIAGAVAMAINIVFSVQWYAAGVPWGWAHRPGLVLIYTGFLGLTLYRAVSRPTKGPARQGCDP